MSRITTRQTRNHDEKFHTTLSDWDAIGYVIRFTCPDCHNENSIIFNMPKSFYKDSRDGTCAKCRKHFMVLTRPELNLTLF